MKATAIKEMDKKKKLKANNKTCELQKETKNNKQKTTKLQRNRKTVKKSKHLARLNIYTVF